MKSLKPTVQESSIMMSSKELAEYDAKMEDLKSQIKENKEDIEDIKAELSKDSIEKNKGTFEEIEATTIDGKTLNVDVVNSTDIKNEAGIKTASLRANTVDTTTGNIDTLESRNGKITSLESEAITVEAVQADTIQVTQVVSDQVNASSVSAADVYADDLHITNFDISNIEADSATIGDATIATAEVGSLKSDSIEFVEIKGNKAKITTLINQTRAITDDEISYGFITIERPNDGGNGNDDPTYIKLPNFSTGWYRVELKQKQEDGSTDDETVFSVNFWNTETTPLVQWSKDHDGDINKFYYDKDEDALIISTYSSGQLYWTSDAKDPFYAPKTYAELPYAESHAFLEYEPTLYHGIVMMGDHTQAYRLEVQGYIKADGIQTEGQHSFWFINEGATISAFVSTVKEWLDYEEDDGSITHDCIEVAGYYGSEALEKVQTTDTGVVLTIDAKYGQDEIELSSEEIEGGEETDLMPVACSFIGVSRRWNKVVND